MTVLVLLAHVGALLGAWFGPGGLRWLLALNLAVAAIVLLFAATRARFLLAGRDWPYALLILFELAVLLGAVWAFRSQRPAVIWSYVGCALHACLSLAAVLFAFLFKMNRLM